MCSAHLNRLVWICCRDLSESTGYIVYRYSGACLFGVLLFRPRNDLSIARWIVSIALSMLTVRVHVSVPQHSVVILNRFALSYAVTSLIFPNVSHATLLLFSISSLNMKSHSHEQSGSLWFNSDLQ